MAVSAVIFNDEAFLRHRWLACWIHRSLHDLATSSPLPEKDELEARRARPIAAPRPSDAIATTGMPAIHGKRGAIA